MELRYLRLASEQDSITEMKMFVRNEFETNSGKGMIAVGERRHRVRAESYGLQFWSQHISMLLKDRPKSVSKQTRQRRSSIEEPFDAFNA